MKNIIDNRYEILEEIGSGGFGHVYKALDQKTSQILALKTLTPPAEAAEFQQFFLESFRNEFALLTKLQHPHLCRVYDYGYDAAKKEYYFTEELLVGAGLLEATAKLSYAECEQLFVQTCRALEYIHSQGFVHHDIKPANILVVQVGKNLQAKIIDFGLAQLKSQTQSVTAGTKRYMAPEMLVEGMPADHRSDFYALGIVFKEVFARFGNEAPSYLPQIFDRLLARDPADRFYHANSVIRVINLHAKEEYPLETKETLRSYAFSSELIGREAVLKEIKTWIKEPSGTQSFGVLGGRGLGKSRLVREIITFVQLEQIPYLQIPKPAGLWETLLAGLPEKTFDDPEMFIEQCVAALFQAAAVYRLIVIDDLHYLEPTAKEILRRAMDQNRESPLFLWTTNPAEEDAKALSHSKTQELKPFTVEETKQYLESFFGVTSIENKTVKEIQKMAAGNPQLLSELLKGWVQTGVVMDRTHQTLQLGEAVQSEALADFAAKEFQQLEGDEKLVFEVLVVHGRRLFSSTLQSILQFSEQALQKTLLQLKHRDLIMQIDKESVDVANTLLREAVYPLIPKEKRQGLHRSLFLFLKDHAGALGDLAYHASGAGDVPEGQGCILKAARQAERRFALKEALHWYEQLKTTEEILLKRAKLQISLGHYAEAKLLYQQVVEQLKEKRTAEKAYALRGLGWLAQREEKKGVALSYFQDSLNILEMCNADYRAVLLHDLGHHYMGERDFAKAAEFFEKSIPLLEKNPNPEYLKNNHLALAYLELGKKEEAIAFATRKLAWAEEQNKEDAIGLSYAELGQIHWTLGRLDEAKRKYQQALESTKKQNSPQNKIKILNDLLSIAQTESHYGDAISYLEQILDDARKISSPQALGQYYLTAGNLYAAIGLFQKGMQYLELAQERLGMNGWLLLSYGFLQDGLGKKEPSCKWFANALVEAKKTKDPRLAAYALFSMYEVTEEKKYLKEGKIFLKGLDDSELEYRLHLLEVSEIEKLLKEENPEHIVEVRTKLAKQALDEGDELKAAQYYKEGKEAVEKMVQNLPEVYQESFRRQPRIQKFLQLFPEQKAPPIVLEPASNQITEETKPLKR